MFEKGVNKPLDDDGTHLNVENTSIMKHNKYKLGIASLIVSCSLLIGTNVASAETVDFSSQSGVEGLSIKWDAPEQARANQKFDYTLTISNGNEMPLSQVKIYQLLPDNLKVDVSEPQFLSPGQDEERMADRKEDYQNTARMRGAEMGKASDATQKEVKGDSKAKVLSWDLGVLNPDESRLIKIQGLPSAEGQINTCFWATSQPVVCHTIEVVKPDLQITQSIVDENGNSRSIFYACEPIILNYVVTNPGTGDLSDVNAKVDLPEGFQYADKENASFSVGNLSGGESKDFTVSIQPTRTGNFGVSGMAMSDKLSAESNRATVEIVQPVLELSTEAPQETYFGREVTYRVTVSNSSDVPALDTVVDFPLDAANRRFTNGGQEIGDGVQTFKLGTLDGGESKSFSVTFDPSAPGTFDTAVTAKAYCAAAVETSIKSVVSGIPALQIYVVDGEDPVKVGEETYYELKIINEGTADDLKINLAGTLPDTLSFVSADGESEISASGQTLTFGALDALSPGESVSWNIRVKGVKAGGGVFKVDLNSQNHKGLRSSEPTTVF